LRPRPNPAPQEPTIVDDARVWESEAGLWTADADHYRAVVDSERLMVRPDAPHFLREEDAVAEASRTPR